MDKACGNKKKLSVALCTYNGAGYIEEQIVSILSQTMPVDEIVVCDDASTDETLEIVERIQRDARIEIRVFKNEKNIGFKENFFSAIDKSSGDLVFLSDQDDVWCPNKVETIVRWFDTHADKMVVFTDALLMDVSGNLLSESLWQRFGFDKKKQKYFDKGYGLDIWAWSNRATGATMALKISFMETLNWRESADAFHDKIIALQGIIARSIGYIDEKLIRYRLHDDQTCGANRLSQEIYSTPLKPCCKTFLDFDMGGVPEKERMHLIFLFKRASFKESWFGWAPILSCSTYIHEYRKGAFRFFCYDFYVSVRHSIRRILNKL